MAAYIIADLQITDPNTFEDYKAQVPATIARFGGRYLARGGAIDTLEGDWTPKRLVILEFPDRASANAWWASEEYASAKALRQRSAQTDLIIVDGL